MIGETLGHFRIEQMIGAGGMGMVYRARDQRLDRDVALKVLPPGTLADEAVRRRFRQEALALSRLNHPNIATVHDFDSQGETDFLVMELIPGSTLDDRILGSGPLTEKEVLRLGMQLAQGLAAAHQEGVIHRDLKPGNLRITPDGRLKILDFGLAMLRASERSNTADTADLTDRHIVGSPPYMAPEQLLGEEVDARADIYAAGAVIYEMATRRRAFTQTGPRLVEAILHESPQPPREINPRISPGLEMVILKALDKEPAHRYQSAREVLVDLERVGVALSSATYPRPRVRRRDLVWAALSLIAAVTALVALGWGAKARLVTPPAAGSIASLAVLPLENLSGDTAQDYFVDGMTDALIADLGRISSLRVISRTSSMLYKGAKKTLPEIARELNVDAVVEGSVLRSGDRIRITAQLVDAPTDRQLWAETYERQLRDVITLQGEVASSIARQIKAKLTPQEQARLANPGTVDPEAHEAYLQGRYLFHTMTEEGLGKAIEQFRRATLRRPDFAIAHAGLASAYILLADEATLPPRQALADAKAEAETALRIDAGLAEAHAALAFGRLLLDWDWSGAENGLRKAIELNPSAAVVRDRYARYLAARGRTDESIAEMRRARELDPLSPLASAGIGGMLYYGRRTAEALKHLRATLEVQPESAVAHYQIGLVQLQNGRFEEAIAKLRRADELSGGRELGRLADLGLAYAAAGRRDEALRMIALWKERSGGRFARQDQLARVWGALGEKDKAFALLEQACEDRSPGVIWIGVDPRFDSLRSDPRFRSLLRRLGLAS